MKKILITGASGFIGSNLVKKLSELDFFNIYACVRNLKKGAKYNKVKYISLDLSNFKSIENLIKVAKFDIIIHLAAKINLNKNKNEKKIYKINTLATKKLALVAKKMKAKFIFASTALVHGKDSKNINIKSRIVTDTYYAKTKYEAEKILKSILPRVCILRFAGVYGLNLSDYLMLNQSITKALVYKKPIIIKDSLDGKRNYIYVKDAVRVIIKAINCYFYGTYLVASKQSLSIKKMLIQISEIMLPKRKLLIIKNDKKVEDKIITPNIKIKKETKFKTALKEIKKSYKL